MKKLLIAAALLLLAVFSFTFIADVTSSPETHAARIASINERIDTVLKLTASSSLASTAVSAIPGDTATPISDKLADISFYFLLVLCILYAEKYLLAVIGFAAFRIVIPLACLFLIYCVFRRNPALTGLGIKLIVCGIILYLAIPASVKVSDLVMDTYQVSIDTTLTNVQTLADKTDELQAAENDAGKLSAVWAQISENTRSLTDKAANLLNRFLETVAVLIVVSCIIPILTLLFFIWVIRFLFSAGSAAFPHAAAYLPAPRERKHRHAEREIES